MKVVIIGRYGEGDILPGPERVARELYSHLKERYKNISFIEYFFDNYRDYSLTKKIFGKKEVNNNVLRLGILPLILILLKEQFDIIHLINSQRFTLIVFLLKPFLKAKYISSFHGFQNDERKVLTTKRAFLDIWLEKLSINKSEKLVFPSKLLLDLFKENYVFSDYKYQIIYNGISEIFFNKSVSTSVFKCEVNSKWTDKHTDSYNFVYYNSFGKGLKELLDKVSVRVNVKLKIFVLGKLEKFEIFNNIEVYFTPLMNQNLLLNFLLDKHFLIKSSAFDAFPTLAIECMAIGIIPIVSEKIGTKEIIKHGINGFIYNSNNNSISNLLENIYLGKFNLKKISENATKIYNNFNWENVSDKYISLYNSSI